jgi:hypothetical protein
MRLWLLLAFSLAAPEVAAQVVPRTGANLAAQLETELRTLEQGRQSELQGQFNSNMNAAGMGPGGYRNLCGLERLDPRRFTGGCDVGSSTR